MAALTPYSQSCVHVTIPDCGSRARRQAIVLHRSRTLAPRHTTRRHNIPVTTRERTLADMGWGPEPTRSHLERAFLKLVRDAGLPSPEVNVRIGPYVVDFLWRDERLVVETDGYAHHSDRTSFETDRRRDRELSSRGLTVLRFTYRDVIEEPVDVVASLRARLFGLTGRSARLG